MARFVALVAILALHCITESIAVAAQSDAPSFCNQQALLAKERTETSYAVRANGEFCDGALFAPHSGRLAVVSVTANSMRADSGRLNASRAGLPPAVSQATILLQGIALRSPVNYQFDAAMRGTASQTTLTPQAALFKLGLSVDQIGWIASISDYLGRRMIVPISTSGADLYPVSITVRPVLNAVIVSYEIQSGSNPRQSGTAKAIAGGLYEVQLTAPYSDPIDIHIWAQSPAGDIDSARFYLASP